MSLNPHTRPLTPEDAAHFLRRTAFGVTDAQVRALVGRDARTVAREALTFGQDLAPGNPFDPMQATGPGAGAQLLRGAWMFELLYGPHPLRERLALAWSSHFVVSTDKSRNVPANVSYLRLLRANAATTDFTAFAQGVARHPAMLRYLDNDQNRRGKPNENFSRELLELFTAGIGTPSTPNYSEADVREGARALSGWTFTGGRGNKNFLEEPRSTFAERQHDAGRKTYLGRTGNLGGEDVVRLAASHPATAGFVVRKLHRAFVADTPDGAAVAGSAETWRRTGGNVRAVLEELLASEAFYASRARIVRSPVEFVVGAVRSLGQPRLEPKRVLNLAQAAGRMGQTLMQPDTVEGWKGGREWVNDSALLARLQLAAALSTAGNAPAPLAEPTPLALLGSERPPLGEGWAALNARQRLYLMLVSPEFQLI